MSTQIIGYFILFGFGALFLGISTLVSKRYSTEGVDDLVAAGRSMPFGMIAASSMVSWVWTITLIGSAEAGFVFGINGGFNYAWGAAVPFFVFIPVVLTLRKKMPKCTTFVEFIHERYGDKLTIIFIIFAVLLSMYILLSQGMGVGIAISYITGIPYKVAVAVPLLIVGLYISKAGLRGSMFNDLIQFFIIGLVLLIIVPVVLKNIGLANMFDSLMDVSTNPSNPNYNPNALNFFSGAGMRYGVVALVVALGQVLLDQGYYSKAVSAASTKTLLRAYLIGTIVAWAPIAIICGNVLGGGGLAMGATVGTNLGVASDVAPFVIESFFGTGLGAVMYLMMIFMAGMTTGGGVLAGVQAISTIDLYKRYIKKDSTEKQQTTFGKRVTLAVSVIMAIIVMFFENASLLQVDIFSGIIFAAPCSAFVAGLIWKKVSAKVAGASIFIGMICGIIAYFAIPDDQINYFVGNLCSLLIPAIVIIIASLTSKYEFDWQKLEKYNPAHEVNISDDK
jgi:Na+/proline symporter